jgi:hypothetical protein
MNCTYGGINCTETQAVQFYVNGKGETVTLCQGCYDHFGAQAYCVALESDDTPDAAAYASGMQNANDTATEMGFQAPSEQWTDVLGKSYRFMAAENETTRIREAEYAREDAEAEEPDLSTYAPWFAALVSKREDCTDTDAFERDAYSGHLSYEIGGTDGHYGPEARDRWLHWFRQDPIRSLYNGNDKRHTLAPMVLSYMATIR